MKHRETAEHKRLKESADREADWKNWGPYVSDRAWGTVREDYSADGSAWDYFPHDHARSRAYRWNEDGLAGFCNRFQNVCLGLAFWNGQDPILKERLFGLSGPEGNHGEDVKEVYFYLDGVPTHSYMKMLYKYPQVAYPYGALLGENRRRDRSEPEYELVDALAEAFANGRYFDITIEYAKAGEEDILCQITAVNRGPDPAPLHILPHIWYRNTWSWGYNRARPAFRPVAGPGVGVHTSERHLGDRYWFVSEGELLFTENDTNNQRLFKAPNPTPYVKDAFHRAIVNGEAGAVNPQKFGSKVAAHVAVVIPPGQSHVLQVRFTNQKNAAPFSDFGPILSQRQQEADEFYAAIHKPGLSEDEKQVQRQAFAGLLWSKQFYHYGVQLWLDGDPGTPPPPASRRNGRNSQWRHLYNLEVVSMPDKWEYPWYAAWDLAFHTLPLALIDPEWAKRQLALMLREWYMHPNGQIAAYEWAFGDVNPPVHAWAAWRVYKIDREVNGRADIAFLEKIFHKLLLNFTWWVNRKDQEGNNVFEGGFLGLDNIGIFDRSSALPTGGRLEQADGTAWMAMYCLNMLAIALEIARHNRAYEDVATKFFEHFIYITHAMNKAREGHGMWDEEDGFFYDAIAFKSGDHFPLKVRSFVGLIPLYAVETIEAETLTRLPRFRERMNWFIKYRPELVAHIPTLTQAGVNGRLMLSLVSPEQLQRLLSRMLDEAQFLSPHGLRGISKEHEAKPFRLEIDGRPYAVGYEPAESNTGLFGGNSNWRGPIWLPVNFLMIESLQKYHHYFGEALKMAFPTGSGPEMDLWQVSLALSRRLNGLFLRGRDGQRPFNGDNPLLQNDPHWRDHILFYEYFHGDTGRGLGASHQTGWTALVAKLIQQAGG